jgi:hypothetical protein
MRHRQPDILDQPTDAPMRIGCVRVCMCVCDAFLLVVHVLLVSKITAGFD